MTTIHPYISHTRHLSQHEAQPPPSPTLTNPDLILPDEPHYRPISLSSQSEVLSVSSYGSRDGHRRSDSGSSAEVGVATTVVVPQRVSSQSASIAATGILSYSSYEHGAPLSDIGEEDDSDASTTKGASRPPSPDYGEHILGSFQQGPKLRQTKRLSTMSSESGGSDNGSAYDQFDTSKLVSDRVATDIKNARASIDEEEAPRRGSKEVEDELAILNDRAEKILANARKRLSSMEDNLSKARHSIILSPSKSSPNLQENGLGQKPAGGLYRSISQSARGNRKGAFPVKPSASPTQHARTGSDIPPPSRRLSRTPEARSASALEHNHINKLGMTTPENMHTHSPSSSRSFTSPLRVLSEEAETSSTPKTSPETPSELSPAFSHRRGLGIHAEAGRGSADLTRLQNGIHNSRSTHGSPEQNSQSRNELIESHSSPESARLHHERAPSAASTRSARELKEQMSEMRSRIAELKQKAYSDSLRRRSLQSVRTASPFNNASSNASPHDRRDSIEARNAQGIDSDVETARYSPVTPLALSRSLDVLATTPAALSSARTDRNIPNLAGRTLDIDEITGIDDDLESKDRLSRYEDAEEELHIGDEDVVAANEEEQIYLNEVLEESLQDVEPEIPLIPQEFLIPELNADEGLSHEDRFDAFDYENMFLHSAMGTYKPEEDSDESSDIDSIETSRQDLETPFEDDSTDEESEYKLTEDDVDINDGEIGIAKSFPINSILISKPSVSQSGMQTSPLLAVTVQSPMQMESQTPSESDDFTSERLQVPRAEMMHALRSYSSDSTATTASYQTAIEGDIESDAASDAPDEILNWGNNIPQQTLMSPRRESSQLTSKLPSPSVNGKRHSRSLSGSNFTQTIPSSPTYIEPRSKSASANYYANIARVNLDTDEDSDADQQATPLARAFPKSQLPRHFRQSSASSQSSTNTQPKPVKAFVNRKARPSMISVANAQSPPLETSSRPSSARPANTEILMESLIKLADPSFSIRNTTRFADLDKDLVLTLLRSLGEVCNGILKSQDSTETKFVDQFRARLVDASEVLLGRSDNFKLEEDEEREDSDVLGDEYGSGCSTSECSEDASDD